jgi:hypothetical protein
MTPTDPDNVEATRGPRTASLFDLRCAVICAIAMTLLVAGVAYLYSTKPGAVSAAVSTWTPNHKAFCAADTILVTASNPPSKITTKGASSLLSAYEAISIYAPTKLVHYQLGALAIAFENVISSPPARMALSAGDVSSRLPAIRSYMRAARPLEHYTSPADKATNACSSINDASMSRTYNTRTAVSVGYDSRYKVVANGITTVPGPMTVAEYANTFSTYLEGIVVVDGPDAKFIFTSGPAVCVTLPKSRHLLAKAIACPSRITSRITSR